MGEVETLTPIRLRYTGEVIDLTKAYDDQDVLHTEPVEFNKQYMDTTVGRVILNDTCPRSMPYHQRPAEEEGPGAAGAVLLPAVRAGRPRSKMLDEIKDLGFLYATGPASPSASTTWSSRRTRTSWSRKREKEVIDVQQQYLDGAITNGERYNKVIEIWSNVTEEVADEMFARAWKRTTRRALPQPDLHHGRLRRPRLASSRSASCPACAA